MELKRIYEKFKAETGILLIVPYGIETCKMDAEEVRKKLLIVPYGIETSQSGSFSSK